MASPPEFRPLIHLPPEVAPTAPPSSLEPVVSKSRLVFLRHQCSLVACSVGEFKKSKRYPWMKYFWGLLGLLLFTVLGFSVLSLFDAIYPLLPILGWLSIALGLFIALQQGVIYYLGRWHHRTVGELEGKNRELITQGQANWAGHTALVRQMSEQLSDANWELYKVEGLRDALKNDLENIEKAVKVYELGIRHEDLASSMPYVEFSCQIFNGSLFTISVGRQIEGFIEFGPAVGAGTRLSGQISLSTLSTTEFKRGITMNVFYIRQDLTPTEAEMISRDPNTFRKVYKFDHLKLMIRTERPEIQIRPLRFGYDQVRRNEPWVR